MAIMECFVTYESLNEILTENLRKTYLRSVSHLPSVVPPIDRNG